MKSLNNKTQINIPYFFHYTIKLDCNPNTWSIYYLKNHLSELYNYECQRVYFTYNKIKIEDKDERNYISQYPNITLLKFEYDYEIKDIKVTLKDLKGITTKVKINTGWKMSDISEVLQHKNEQYKKIRFCYIFKGKDCMQNATVGYYHIMEGSTIFVVNKLRG